MSILLALLVASSPVEKLDTFVYPAKVESVYDGDTVTVDILWAPQLVADTAKIRLFGLDTPEIRTRDPDEKLAGYAARDFLRGLLKDRKVRVQLVKDGKRYTGKFGRWLARLWVQGAEGTFCPVGRWCDVNAHLIKTGHARVASY